MNQILFNSHFLFLNSMWTFLTLQMCTYYTIVYSYKSIKGMTAVFISEVLDSKWLKQKLLRKSISTKTMK